jgi:ribosomal-protein-alanine N-acetyltransferase
MADSYTLPPITTTRLLLRPFVPGDLRALHGIMNEPGIMHYFPTPTPPDTARVERLIARQIEAGARYGRAFWAMEWPNDGSLLGWCGLQYLEETGETEVGYLLTHSYWGRGLATEAARASVAYGFTHFHLPEIIGITHPENRKSQHVLEKCGLRFTARTRYFEMDCFRYAISRAAHAGITAGD